jgi:hypothetical protein
VAAVEGRRPVQGPPVQAGGGVDLGVAVQHGLWTCQSARLKNSEKNLEACWRVIIDGRLTGTGRSISVRMRAPDGRASFEPQCTVYSRTSTLIGAALDSSFPLSHLPTK